MDKSLSDTVKKDGLECDGRMTDGKEDHDSKEPTSPIELQHWMQLGNLRE